MKIFYILLIVIFWFILNIVLYYISTPYREMMQWIKHNEDIWITDEYRISSEEIKAYQNEQLWSPLWTEALSPSEKTVEKYRKGRLSTVAFEDLEEKNKNVTLGIWGEKIYNLFSAYNLTELQQHSALMDVTSEYPDKYFEYYTLDLTLYIFPTKGYSEVIEIFELVQSDDIYTINELDNFGEESFYINLSGIDDGYVRLIISSNGVVFWLKIADDQYNNVKQILEQL